MCTRFSPAFSPAPLLSLRTALRGVVYPAQRAHPPLFTPLTDGTPRAQLPHSPPPGVDFPLQDPAPEPTPPPPRRKRGTGVEIVPEAVRKRCAAALAKEHASLQREHEERSARAESKRAVDARYTAVLRRRVEAHPAAPRLKSPLPLEEALEAERRKAAAKRVGRGETKGSAKRRLARERAIGTFGGTSGPSMSVEHALRGLDPLPASHRRAAASPPRRPAA